MSNKTRKFPFNHLPATVRQRLVTILQRGGDPTLVRFWPGSKSGWWGAAFFALAGLGAAIYVALWLFDEDSRKDAYFDREIYALLAGLVFLSAAGAASLIVRAIFPPPDFPLDAKLVTGGYVIAIGQRDVTIGTLADDQPTITNVYRNGVYQHSRLELGFYLPELTLYCGAQAEAEELLAKLTKAKAVFRELRDQRDERGLAELDPLAPCTISGVFEAPSDQGPTISGPPSAVRWAQWLGAVVVALVVAGGWFTFMKSRCKTIPGCHTLGDRYGY